MKEFFKITVFLAVLMLIGCFGSPSAGGSEDQDNEDTDTESTDTESTDTEDTNTEDTTKEEPQQECDDGLLCATGEDVDGECVYTVNEGSCLIDEECYEAAEDNPTNACQQCNPENATDEWSGKDDGFLCTTGEDIDGECVYTVNTGHCLIDGACYDDGEDNPSNICESCNAENATQWSAKAAGISCGHCLVCSAGASCQRDTSCCNLNNWEGNLNDCGLFTEEDLWVNSGCTALNSFARRNFSSGNIGARSFSCENGEWQTDNSSGGPSSGDLEFKRIARVLWQEGCYDALEDIEKECTDMCSLEDLPYDLRTGFCIDHNGESLVVPDGGAFGLRKCLPGAANCEEISVECHNNQWINKNFGSASRSSASVNSYTDNWFRSFGGVEQELRAEACTSRSCSVLDTSVLTSSYYYGVDNCGTIAYGIMTNPFKENETIRVRFALQQPGSASEGDYGLYTCGSDFAWVLSTRGSGSGVPCSTCEDYSWSTTWEKNGNLFLESNCSNICKGTVASNYLYNGHQGSPGATSPRNTVFTRCIYSNGELTSSVAQICNGANEAQEWSDSFWDSTCPETVEILNDIAEANDNVEPCTSQNCVFWKTTRGYHNKTVSL